MSMPFHDIFSLHEIRGNLNRLYYNQKAHMHIHCPTSQGILLLLQQDERGIYLVRVGENTALPGHAFSVAPGLPIQAQLVALAEKILGHGLPPTAFEILQTVAFSLLQEETAYTLYAMRLVTTNFPFPLFSHNVGAEAPDSWQNLPEVIRQMPATKARIAYLKVWQCLAGVDEQEIRVVDRK